MIYHNHLLLVMALPHLAVLALPSESLSLQTERPPPPPPPPPHQLDLPLYEDSSEIREVYSNEPGPGRQSKPVIPYINPANSGAVSRIKRWQLSSSTISPQQLEIRPISNPQPVIEKRGRSADEETITRVLVSINTSVRSLGSAVRNFQMHPSGLLEAARDTEQTILRGVDVITPIPKVGMIAATRLQFVIFTLVNSISSTVDATIDMRSVFDDNGVSPIIRDTITKLKGVAYQFDYLLADKIPFLLAPIAQLDAMVVDQRFVSALAQYADVPPIGAAGV